MVSGGAAHLRTWEGTLPWRPVSGEILWICSSDNKTPLAQTTIDYAIVLRCHGEQFNGKWARSRMEKIQIFTTSHCKKCYETHGLSSMKRLNDFFWFSIQPLENISTFSKCHYPFVSHHCKNGALCACGALCASSALCACNVLCACSAPEWFQIICCRMW